MSKLIRFIVGSVISLIVTLIFISCITTRVGVGYVGVKVKLAGSTRGVQDMQLKTGWVMYNPLTEDVVEFPVSVQNVILTADAHEGNEKTDDNKDHGIDESITFSSIEGVNANADVGFSFHIDPNMAPHLYARFKQTNMRELAYGYMRNVLRESFNEIGSKMTIQDIYGSGKTELIRRVNEKCRDVLSKEGIVIDQLTINGGLRLPPNVVESINNAIAATQNAIQAENKVRQVKAEADQAVALAYGQAEAIKKRAQGDADALTINTTAQANSKLALAEAEAKANAKINSSLNPQVLQYKALTTWDGKLPTVTSGAVPWINIH